ncbi:hypothetical protein MKW98_029296, partial [Papaver atlanticum]
MQISSRFTEATHETVDGQSNKDRRGRGDASLNIIRSSSGGAFKSLESYTVSESQRKIHGIKATRS